ncbi:nucleotidyl transferase AbiEii/AbiGii toxin family protein [Paraburkholderia sp. USG1]|uniref:nucleotidyl transferase AbiEii/AbiGii toxin family protein n=1 Tax=Paraburkholderia sp. USG1 TaxID=2952268 RepID=UPI0028643097|nr:nucleotidyl transferase AbiEii/AbiGii toxin family protein [Paraburkholderia sp. USG1]MDR8402191.1 nucleotidyl transferase AbiEii/AbiGii toxin family protein [Paraburkholderia sp. USG1]
MSSTLPSLKVAAERPVHPVTAALLAHVQETANWLGAKFVVAGATARDLVLWHVHGIRAERATRDVDVAVCAISWNAYGALIAGLERTGLFRASTGAQQTLVFDDPDIGHPVPLDLVPFGELEAPEGSVAWPPKGEVVMNVLGFREAIDTSVEIDIGERLTVPVVTLPSLALLKILAWHDRRALRNADASDLLLILRNYCDAGNAERIWVDGADLLEQHDFDVDLAASALLGRESRQIALPATFDAVSAILSDNAVYDVLRRDMLARAVIQMLDDFPDGSDRTLSAFRDAFLGISTSA